MAADSDYAQRQFRMDKAERAKSEQVDLELRTLRKKVQVLEEKISSLSTELSRRRVIGETRRGYS